MMRSRTYSIKCSLLCFFVVFFSYAQQPSVVSQRIERLNALNEIKVAYNPLVMDQIIKFSRRKSFPKTMGLAKYYFPLFQKKLAMYGLPEELKYLTVVESNLKTTATSHVGAQGLWQFMRATGKQLGLYENAQVNLFNDPVASTDAACRYLKMLYSKLGDWELALAAYNCGIGRVQKILKKTGKQSFWEIMEYLPKETQLYVPSFLAVQYLMNYYRQYNLEPTSLAIAFSDVEILLARQQINLQNRQWKSSKEKLFFNFINPHLKTDLIPKGTYYYQIKKSHYR